jgi:hypothetical protein
MKYLINIFFIFNSIIALAQGVEIGQWRMHTSFQDALHITETENEIFCATTLGLYSINKTDKSVQLYNKATILNDNGVAAMTYHTTLKILIIVYSNGNIDLLYENGDIVNLSDLKRKNIVGDKTIHSVTWYGNKAYLNTGFGIVVLDLIKQEVEDTYIIGPNGSTLSVYKSLVGNDTIYAATPQGLAYAIYNNQNLANYNNWHFLSGINIPFGACNHISIFNKKVIFELQNDIYYLENSVPTLLFKDKKYTIKDCVSSNSLLTIVLTDTSNANLKTNANALLFFNPKLEQVSKVTNEQAAFLISDFLPTTNKNEFWIAERYLGLTHITKTGFERFVPNAPIFNTAFDFVEANNTMYVAGGSIEPSYQYRFNESGFYTFYNEQWNSYNKYVSSALSDVYDLIAVAANNTEVYFASFGWGLVGLKNGELKNYKYGTALQQTINDTARYRVVDLAFDSKNNLWMTNNTTTNPIVVKTPNDEWRSFSTQGGKIGLTKLLIDKNDQIWMADYNSGGILVYSPGNDVLDKSDDEFRVLGKGAGNGNLPDAKVLCMEEDKNGQIWVGTEAGIVIFYNPESILTPSTNNDAQQIIVSGSDSIPAYLFQSELIKDIKVDGANRKWIATSHGVWLISEDGLENLLHFNTDNSPLLSNEVEAIGIQNKSGEIFFGTSLGICSYKGTATAGASKHAANEVYAYPNPVPADYNGIIAIKGLVDNAFVKITDVNGQLIYSTQALGGQAVWDGKNLKGEKTGSSIYLVFSTDAAGKENFVTKIMYLR